MVKITYNPEVDVLSIKIKKGAVVESDVQDNCVIDFDSTGNITNIDVFKVDLADLLKLDKKKVRIKTKK